MAKKRDYSYVGFLILALAVVIVLMWQIRKNVYLVPSERIILPKGVKVGIIDSTYWNYLQYISVTRPNSSWQMKSFGEIDSLIPEDTTKAVIQNTTPLLELVQNEPAEHRGVIRVGVIKKSKD